MNNAGSQPHDSIDIRLLARQDLPHEAFPGGLNQGFRVFFTPEVHRALWQHSLVDTSVEICGVLVGTWHRDQAGPFVKVVESIRGEGAETRFAEVTFTHETWAKINAQMDTKFAKFSIVGWYHTHPDFGIFLSDRDQFIQEHFFSGPGQVAHVIDPIRRTEGVFVWRDGKPVLTEHFWVGDRLLASPAGGTETSGGSKGMRSTAVKSAGGSLADGAQNADTARRPRAGDFLPPPSRLALYGAIFLLGYLLSNILAAWEHQRFVESELASNGVLSLLRMGLADELDNLNGDLAAMVKALATARSATEKKDDALADAATEIARASRRISAIKMRYANTPAEDDTLRRLLRDNVARLMPQQKGEMRDQSGTTPEPTAAPGGTPNERAASTAAGERKTSESSSNGSNTGSKVQP
jgi:proteasome lid subunit RPN8/RPN11